MEVGHPQAAMVADAGEEEGEGRPKPLAADDASYRQKTELERADASELSFNTENLFYEWQARVDKVARTYGLGHAAPKPMVGEKLRDYKRRTVSPWKPLSNAFKDVDLRVLSVADAQAFAVACDDILTAAEAEAKNPKRVPDGWLAERAEQSRAGHTITRFYGRPAAWLSNHMPPGRRVKRINRMDGGDGRLGGVAYQRD